MYQFIGLAYSFTKQPEIYAIATEDNKYVAFNNDVAYATQLKDKAQYFVRENKGSKIMLKAENSAKVLDRSGWDFTTALLHRRIGFNNQKFNIQSSNALIKIRNTYILHTKCLTHNGTTVNFQFCNRQNHNKQIFKRIFKLDTAAVYEEAEEKGERYLVKSFYGNYLGLFEDKIVKHATQIQALKLARYPLSNGVFTYLINSREALSKTENNELASMPFNGDLDIQFVLTQKSGKITIMNTGKCLTDVDNKFIFSECTGNDNQIWYEEAYKTPTKHGVLLK